MLLPGGRVEAYSSPLRRIPDLDSPSIDVLVAAFGKPGQIFYTKRKAQND